MHPGISRCSLPCCSNRPPFLRDQGGHFCVCCRAAQPASCGVHVFCVCANPATPACMWPIGSGSVTAVAEALVFDLILVKFEQPRVEWGVSGYALLRSPGQAMRHLGFAAHVFGDCSVGPYCSLFRHSVVSDCDSMDCSTPGLPVHHHLSEPVQTSPLSR